MKFYFREGDQKVWVEAEFCKGAQRGLGLMFKKREAASALIFDFPEDTRQAITSLFCFFPFVAVWLDGKNQVLESRVVNPFRFAIIPKQKFRRLIEIPINDRYNKEVNLIVGNKRFKK